MKFKILTIVGITTALCLASACGKDSKKKGASTPKPTPSESPAPQPKANNAKPDSSTDQTSQQTIKAWSELQGKAVAFQQSVPADVSKFLPGFYETYFANGQANSDLQAKPADVQSTVCFLRFAFQFSKAKTMIDSGARFVISEVEEENKGTYNESTLIGELENGSYETLDKIICRKHVDGGPVTPADLQTAFGSTIQLQSR